MKTFGEHEKLFADCQRRVMHIVGKCLDNIDEAANSIKPEAVSNYMHTLQCVRGGWEGHLTYNGESHLGLATLQRRRREKKGEEGDDGRRDKGSTGFERIGRRTVEL